MKRQFGVFVELIANSFDKPGAVHHNRKQELERTALGLLEALNSNPHSAKLYNNLGVVFHDLNREADAIRCYERAIFLRPEYSIALNNFGVALAALNRHEDAIQKYEIALSIQSDYAEALNNVGVSLHAIKRDEEAATRFEQALVLKPSYFEATTNLAHTLKKLKRWDEAIEKYRLVLMAQPMNAFIHLLLAETLGRSHRTDEAIKTYREIIALHPDNADGHAGLAFMLQEVGHLKEARSNFERAISINPRNASYYRGWALNSKVTPGDAFVQNMLELASRLVMLSDTEKVQLNFALGKALADIGRYEESFDHLLAGNALKRRRITYDEEEELNAISRISEVFTAEFIRKQQLSAFRSQVPIFIVGMPRSGSTLVEQILSSHSNVRAGGELHALANAIADTRQENGSVPFPEVASAWRPERLLEIGRHYLNSLKECIPNGLGQTSVLRVTDKRLDNFCFIGLIHLLFPHARIIHTTRNPIDTCLSCFSLLFEAAEFTYDLGELGRRYNAYERLMRHWQSILPVNAILNVKYENMVTNTEVEARRLVAYCGLEWDPECLNFYQNRRPVRTASVIQVRQPIDLSPTFPPVKSRFRSFRHAHRDGVSLFG